jgi:capsular exopolysaccharide synthesis family protein
VSKIFEALSRVRGEVAQTILPIVEGSNGRASQPSELDGAASVSIPGAAGEVPDSDALGLASVRTLPLRVVAPSPLLPFDSSQWQASEQYRIARTKIVQHPRSPRMIVISSAGAGDGKSITAINIAGALGLKTGTVLLVDADFRKSSIHVQLGLPEGPGLGDVLAGACSVEEALVRVEQFAGLYVLSAGTSKANPVELLDNSRWPALCAKLRRMFDYIIVDSPPMAAVADYDLIQAACDGLILVARPDHTSRRLCMKALQDAPADKLIGVLFNCVAKWFLGKYTSPDYYYYTGGGKYKH